MLRETFAVGPLGCNCSLLVDETTRETIVVDPGGDEDEIIARLEALQAKPKAMIITHAHVDHLGAIPALQKKYGMAAWLNENDRPLWDNVAVQSMMLRMPPLTLPEFEPKLSDGFSLGLGTQELGVVFTPGHTPGSVCFHCAGEKLLITGDTLFRGSIGRTDLWGGSFETIIESIQQRLMTMPEDTVVVPGHGPLTTIADELRHNPFLRDE